MDQCQRSRSGAGPELSFHTHRQAASDLFTRTRDTPYTLGEGWRLGRACSRQDVKHRVCSGSRSGSFATHRNAGEATMSVMLPLYAVISILHLLSCIRNINRRAPLDIIWIMSDLQCVCEKPVREIATSFKLKHCSAS